MQFILLYKLSSQQGFELSLQEAKDKAKNAEPVDLNDLKYQTPVMQKKIEDMRNAARLEMTTKRRPSYGLGQSADRTLYNTIFNDELSKVGVTGAATKLGENIGYNASQRAAGTAAANLIRV